MARFWPRNGDRGRLQPWPVPRTLGPARLGEGDVRIGAAAGPAKRTGKGRRAARQSTCWSCFETTEAAATRCKSRLPKRAQEAQGPARLDQSRRSRFGKMAKERQLDETTIKICQAQMLMMREDYDGAAKVLAEAKALSPKNLQVQRMIIRLGADSIQKSVRREAMEVLNSDGRAVRRCCRRCGSTKADNLIHLEQRQQDKEQLKRELASLASSASTNGPSNRRSTCGAELAGRYLNLNMPEEARQYLTLGGRQSAQRIAAAAGVVLVGAGCRRRRRHAGSTREDSANRGRQKRQQLVVCRSPPQIAA